MAQRERRRVVLLGLVAVAAAASSVVAVAGPASVVRSGTQFTASASALFRDDDPASVPAAGPPPAESDMGGTAGTSAGSAAGQAGIVEAEDARITRIVSGAPPAVVPYESAAGPQSLPTLVLTPRSRPYDLNDLQLLGGVVRQPGGSWLFVRSIVVGKGAQLRIQQPGAVLRMSSGPSGFASIVASKGTLMLAGDATAPLTVTSWDPARNTADGDAADGRAYIRAIGSQMDLAHVAVTGLGFWSGRTGGIAWTGSSSVPSTGSAVDSQVSGNHYGIFTSRATGVVLSDTSLRDNELDGLLVHHDTASLTARNVSSTGNGRDGVAVVRGAEKITLSATTASGNTGDGIRIDGSPLADVATASGASTARSAFYTIQGCTSADNGGTGILVTSADDVAITSNSVSGADGIVLRGPSSGARVAGNTVDAATFGIAVRGGVTGADLLDNTVRSAVIGLHVTDSVATLHRNTITAARYGVSLVGQVSGTSVAANTIGGRGLAAVDLNRIAVAATADVTGNDDQGWVVDRDDVRYWLDYTGNHPLLLLWLLIVLLPIAARLWGRRRRDAATSHPYANVAPGPPAPLRIVRSDPPAGPATPPPPGSGATPHRTTRVTLVTGDRAGR